MDFDASISLYITKRQSNISNYSNSNFFKKKILSSIFESSNSFYCFTKKWENNFSSFCFSNDGNFFANGLKILKLNEDLTIESSMSLEKTSRWANRVVFNNQSTKIFALSPNVTVSLFIHDIATNETIEQKSTGLDFVDISVNTYDDNIFATCSKDGKVYLNDLRLSTVETIYEKEEKIKSAQFHPKNSNLLLFVPDVGNEIFLYDIRNRERVFYFDLIFNHKLNNCESTFNKTGDKILVSFENSNPVVYEENNPYPIFEFDHLGFKSTISKVPYLTKMCFAGPNDEFVACSSLSCNTYIWKIPNKRSNYTTGSIQKVNSAKFVLNHDNLYGINYSYSKSILTCLDREYSFWSPLKLNSKPDEKPQTTKRVFFTKLYLDVLIEFSESENFANHKEYFNKKFEFSENVSPKNICYKFRKDLNITYIKTFIDNYTFNFKQKNIKIIEKVETILKNEKLQLEFFGNNYWLVDELIKAYKTKHFIKKSIFYLNKQLEHVEKLQNSVFLELLETKGDVNKKLMEFKKIKIIFKSMIYSLEIIIRKNFNLYEKPMDLAYSVIKSYFKNYKTYGHRYYLSEKIFEDLKKFEDPGIYIDEESMTSKNDEKNLFFYSKSKQNT